MDLLPFMVPKERNDRQFLTFHFFMLFPSAIVSQYVSMSRHVCYTTAALIQVS